MNGITVIWKKDFSQRVPVTARDRHEHECETKFHNAKMRRVGHLVCTKGVDDKEVAPMPFIEPYAFMETQQSEDEGKKEKIISIPKSVGEKK